MNARRVVAVLHSIEIFFEAGKLHFMVCSNRCFQCLYVHRIMPAGVEIQRPVYIRRG